MTRVAVVGGGPAGLVALKELREAGCDAVLFEASAELGGVFAAGRRYDGAQLTTSSLIVAFGCFPPAPGAPPALWTSEEYCDYLQRFADAFALRAHIFTGHAVTAVELLGPGGASAPVRVTVAVAAAAEATAAPAVQAAAPISFSAVFDAACICSGLNAAPPADAPRPPWPGLADFEGRVLHAAHFRSAAEVAGLRVLVVGLGESGSDICLLVAQRAAASAVSTRSGPGYLIPRRFGGAVSDLDTNRAYHALPRWLCAPPSLWHSAKTAIEGAFAGPDDDARVLAAAAAFNAARGASPFARFGTKNHSFVEAAVHHGLQVRPAIARFTRRGAVFADGSLFEADVLILATGYAPRFPFLSAELQRRLADVRGALYKRVLLPDHGAALGFCGLARPGLGAIPPLAELAARYFAGVLSGALPLPSEAVMREAIARDAAAERAAFALDAGRITALCDYLPAMEDLASLIGCRPRLMRLLLTHPRLFAKVLCGPLCESPPRARTRRALARIRNRKHTCTHAQLIHTHAHARTRIALARHAHARAC